MKPGEIDSVGRHPRLSWEGQCPNLRAGTGKDKGSYQAVRPIHPEEDRVITVREAARLQGFPDSFRFHPTVWHSFRMIGNSVSPIIAQAILSLIAERMGAAQQVQMAAE
nr:DNA cytosine methyltransferase [Bradyrhizobium sp. 188]